MCSRWSRSLTCTLLLLPLLFSFSASAADIGVHGPILQWHGDPATTMTITWIERRLPQPPPPAKWVTAPGGFGYDGPAIATELPDMRGRYTSVAVRSAIDLSGVPGESDLVLQTAYDDGLIVWLNGAEVLRIGVSEGQGDEARGVVSHEASGIETFTITNWRDHVHPDDDQPNIIAIEGHNVAIESSDFCLATSFLWRDELGDHMLLRHDQRWQLFVGGAPEPGWQRSLSGAEPFDSLANTIIPANVGMLHYRALGEETWRDMQVEALPFADTGEMLRRAELVHLTPDTSYEFTLPQHTAEHRPDPDQLFHFRTAPLFEHGDERTISFVTGGDMYHRREWLDAMNRQAGHQDPLFALLGGDLAYANGRDARRWYDWFDSWSENAVAPGGRMIPMIVVIGNHETGSRLTPEEAAARGVHPHAKFFFSLFVRPDGRTNYHIDFGSLLRILCLDSNEVQRVEEQTDWLRTTLADTDAQYTFACYHKPAYGTGVKEDIEPVRRLWSPLFEEFRITAVFENDHHVYKRTLPVRRGVVDHERGVLYLGDGAWGVETRTIPDYSHKPYIARAVSIRHLIRVDLDPRNRIETYTAIDADGEVIDSWGRRGR